MTIDLEPITAKCPVCGCDVAPEPGTARCWIHEPVTASETTATRIDLEPERTYPEPAERRPGEFARHPHTGAPYVAHPTETVKRSGLKADLLAEAQAEGIQVPPGVTVKALQDLLPTRPKRVMYGRPSGLGKQIENATNLQKWAERMVALGIATDSALAEEARRLVELDPESPEFRSAADQIATTAKRCAGATLAAERGTHHHELTEDFDQDRDPIARMAAGEDLGVPTATQQALLEAWDRMLRATGLEVLATEATVVDDVWRQAGTLDRIARLTRPLCFVTGDEETVKLPAGTVLVLDLKTGKLRLEGGQPTYWHTYAVQVASYAQSVPYDPDTDQRSEWPWPIDQRWGIIAHLDVRAALDGEAVCQLIAVDLEAGRYAGGLCVAAKEWERRCGLFGLIDDARIAVPVAPTPIGDLLPVAVAAIAEQQERVPAGLTAPGDTATITPSFRDVVITPGFRDVVIRRIDELRTNNVKAAQLLRDRWPQFVPGMKGDHVHTDVELQQIIGALEAAEVEASKAAEVDEGRRMETQDVAAVIARYEALSAEQRAVLAGWAKEANAAGVSFNLRLVPSQRRFEIYRACLRLAELVDGDDLDLCRATVASVIPTAAFPTVAIGHALGSLTIAEAELLVRLAEAVRTDEPALQYDLQGGVSWRWPDDATPNQTNDSPEQEDEY